MDDRTTYLVIAYRWGWTNNSWYIVYGGSDRTKACALATAEANDRGGKYGCVVYEFDQDGTGYKSIAYEGSAYGEKEPEHNEKLEYFSRLGHFMDSYATGKVLLPDPMNPGRLIYTEVETPQVVKDEVGRQARILEVWRRSMESAKARDTHSASDKP